MFKYEKDFNIFIKFLINFSFFGDIIFTIPESITSFVEHILITSFKSLSEFFKLYKHLLLKL